MLRPTRPRCASPRARTYHRAARTHDLPSHPVMERATMETRSGGVRIHFSVHGTGAPVLLVHGYPLSGELWDGVLPYFQTDHRLIVPDLRGHGRSEVADRAEMDDLADDLLAVLEAADEHRPVVLVGMSMGGYAALAFCRRHRERVRALAL